MKRNQQHWGFGPRLKSWHLPLFQGSAFLLESSATKCFKPDLVPLEAWGWVPMESDRLMWLIISCKKWKKWNKKYTGSVSFQKMVVTWQQLPLRAHSATAPGDPNSSSHRRPTCPCFTNSKICQRRGRSCWQFAVRCMCGMHRHPWNRIFCLLTFCCSANPRE